MKTILISTLILIIIYIIYKLVTHFIKTNKSGGHMTEHSIDYEKVIISMVVENWRFINLFDKVISKLDINEQTKYSNQIRYLKKVINDCLEEVELRIVDIEHQEYDPGMRVTAVNIDDFTGEDKQLIITQVMEPLIIDKNGTVKRTATVLLGEK